MKNFLILLLFFGPVLVACRKEKPAKSDETVAENEPQITFRQVTTLYSEDAKMKIKLKANIQFVEQNKDVVYPDGLEITMYSSITGIKTTELRADSGRFVKDAEKYLAYGNVVVRNLTDRTTLYTEEINWNRAKREITTDKAVRILTPAEQLNGIGLTSNESFSKYKIWKPTGIFQLKN